MCGCAWLRAGRVWYHDVVYVCGGGVRRVVRLSGVLCVGVVGWSWKSVGILDFKQASKVPRYRSYPK